MNLSRNTQTVTWRALFGGSQSGNKSTRLIENKSSRPEHGHQPPLRDIRQSIYFSPHCILILFTFSVSVCLSQDWGMGHIWSLTQVSTLNCYANLNCSFHVIFVTANEWIYTYVILTAPLVAWHLNDITFSVHPVLFLATLSCPPFWFNIFYGALTLKRPPPLRTHWLVNCVALLNLLWEWCWWNKCWSKWRSMPGQQ